MKTFGIFHDGGPHHPSMDPDEVMEFWPSEQEARAALADRVEFSDTGRALDAHYVIKGPKSFSFFGVTHDAYIDLYRRVKIRTETGGIDITTEDEPYARLHLGPRGGINKQPY